MLEQCRQGETQAVQVLLLAVSRKKLTLQDWQTAGLEAEHC